MSAEWVEIGGTIYLVGAVTIFVVGCLIMGYIAGVGTWRSVTRSEIWGAAIPPLVVAVFWPPIVIVLLLSSPVFVGIATAIFIDFTGRTIEKLRSKHVSK